MSTGSPQYRASGMDDLRLRAVLLEAVSAVRTELEGVSDWSARGSGHASQFAVDVLADRAGCRVLSAAGFGILSEESGLRDADRELLVVADPIDGSSNASRRLPWYATSLCALDTTGPRVAVVVNQVAGETFDAIRGSGARCNGEPIRASSARAIRGAALGFSGWPPRHGGWGELRVLDAAALDLCAVAAGRLDGWVDCDLDAHGPWDYMGGMLVCQESGAVVLEALGRELVCRDPLARRTPIAAATSDLGAELMEYRRSLF
jgi:myo-inositol-1(or 4)-monophosphatase